MSAVTEVRPRRGRRIAGWAGIVVALGLVGLVGSVVAGADSWSERAPLDPESAGPGGARAVTRVLEAEGVRVVVVRDRAAAEAALDGDATLVLPDSATLADDAVTAIADRASDVVLIDPRSRTLRLLLPGAALAGVADDTPLAPSCDDPDAVRAGDIVAGGLFSPGEGMTACYPGDDGSALLRSSDGDRTVTAIDGRAILANDSITRAGNAALALGLLGARPTVVWYMPSLADADGIAAPSLGELTPEWVTPAITLLVIAAVVAGIWRGRRFGPLVAENLPVTVRANETTAGRGRLYTRSRDAGHALAQLRASAVARLARLLGLGPHAGSTEVADATAALLGTDRARVRGILHDDVPHDERALVDLADRLRDLEAGVRAAVRPEGTHR